MSDFTLNAARTSRCRIHVGRGEIDRLRERLAALLPPPRKVALVSDRNLAPFFTDRIETALVDAGYTCHPVLLPAGEEAKSLRILGNLWDRLITFGVEATSVVVAVGGGVVGDVAGFAAATLHRGIAFAQ